MALVRLLLVLESMVISILTPQQIKFMDLKLQERGVHLQIL
jgi:hypothetical protein